MKKHIYQLVFILMIISVGCFGPSKKDPKLVEAFEIHKESIDLGAKAMEVCKKLPASDTMRSNFESRLEDWGDNVVEVPGFHYHHDGLGHHHNRPPLKLSPDDALLVQKELRDSIRSIYERILRHETELRSQ